jgi:hypothetical protein
MEATLTLAHLSSKLLYEVKKKKSTLFKSLLFWDLVLTAEINPDARISLSLFLVALGIELARQGLYH